MSDNLIIDVENGSIAERLGIKPGWKLVSINGHDIKDILDYLFYSADERINMEVEAKDGFKKYSFKKNYDEIIGLRFKDDLLDKPKICRNKCIFCFVDQMPGNMRKSLYVKDDDYRLSFLYGNFITLSNVTDADIKRILDMKLSPLYISVHATDDDVRKRIMRNPNASGILSKIKMLADGGIDMNCQVVLTREINDGHVLDKTVEDLAKFYPSVSSLAVVPVGLTKYRDGLSPILKWDKDSSLKLIKQVKNWEEKFMKMYDTPFVFASDEFYTMAGINVPDAAFYDGFPQLENGVGLIAKFREEFKNAFDSYDNKNIRNKKVAIATGYSAYSLIESMAKRLSHKFNIDVKVYKIKNEFFGELVTVSGLITGRDLIKQLKGKELGDVLIIPESMLKEDEDVFLDDVKLSDVMEQLCVKVAVSRVDGLDFIRKVAGDI